jgi:hypothetical protein
MRLHFFTTAAALFVVALSSRIAQADAAQSAAAEALFDEGRRLMEAGRYGDACGRFEESQRLDQGIGTQYNLADCWEKTGRIASAWGAFLDVSYTARKEGQPEREKVARDRAQAIAPRLPRLTVVVAQGADDASLRITRDGVLVGKGQWSTSLPVDPGTHRIAATAQGKEPWETTVQLAETATVTVQIPALATLSKEPAAPQQPLRPSSGGVHRGSAWALGGISLAGIALGSVYGLAARSRNDDSMAYCSGKTVCSQQGVDLRDEARRDALVSTIAFGVGAAALAGAVVLWATAPNREQPPKSAMLKVSALPLGGARFGLEGSW